MPFITFLLVLLVSVWKWKWWYAAPVVALFLIIDGAYFAANLFKVPDGGWFPLLVGFIASFVGSTLGLVLGVASAYFGGKFDLLFQRVITVSLETVKIVRALPRLDFNTLS